MFISQQDCVVGVIPEIPDYLADNTPVFLFHWLIVVLPERARPYLGDVLAVAVVDQAVVHELAPGIRPDNGIYPQDIAVAPAPLLTRSFSATLCLKLQILQATTLCNLLSDSLI